MPLIREAALRTFFFKKKKPKTLGKREGRVQREGMRTKRMEGFLSVGDSII